MEKLFLSQKRLDSLKNLHEIEDNFNEILKNNFGECLVNLNFLSTSRPIINIIDGGFDELDNLKIIECILNNLDKLFNDVSKIKKIKLSIERLIDENPCVQQINGTPISKSFYQNVALHGKYIYDIYFNEGKIESILDYNLKLEINI